MLFRKKMDKACHYCVHSTKLNEDTMLCTKCGIVSWEGQCWRFHYDPLKRIPSKQKALDFSKYDEDDFSL